MPWLWPAAPPNWVWHDVENAGYEADLPAWADAEEMAPPGPVLELGAGTGRLTLELARAGRHVDAVDFDEDLLGILDWRARGLRVACLWGDATRPASLPTGDRYALVALGANLLSLLPRDSWDGLLDYVTGRLGGRGLLGVALPAVLPEPFGPRPLAPDLGQIAATRLASVPFWGRARADAWEMYTARATWAGWGLPRIDVARQRFTALTPTMFTQAAEGCGLVVRERLEIPMEDDETPGVLLLLAAR